MSKRLEDERVSEQRALVTFNYVPAVVVVLGPPIRDTVRLECEPVVEVNGKIVPLARGIDLLFDSVPRSNARRSYANAFWFVDDSTKTGFWNLRPESIDEFRRSGFRWYRIKGGARVHGDKLPMQDRGETDSVGVFRPPRVFAETFHTVAFATLAVISQGGELAEIAKKILEQGKAGTRLQGLFNVPFGEQAAGYVLDRERGIIKFDRPVGVLQYEGTTESSFLREAKVEIEFGYDRKPSENVPLTIDLRYWSAWTRGAGIGQVERGKVVADPKVTRLPAIPEGSAPYVAFRPDLLQVNGLAEGTGDAASASNKALLDAVAERHAKAIFAKPQSTDGEVIQFHRPLALETNGIVSSVTWKTDGELPRTVGQVNGYPPLAPKDPLPRTHARTGPFSAIADSPSAPRGLRGR